MTELLSILLPISGPGYSPVTYHMSYHLSLMCAKHVKGREDSITLSGSYEISLFVEAKTNNFMLL